MNENRICPVCENEIPEDASFLCPHCQFELRWLEDERVVERVKQSSSGKIYKPEMTDKKTGKNWGIGEFLVQVVFEFIFEAICLIVEEALD